MSSLANPISDADWKGVERNYAGVPEVNSEWLAANQQAVRLVDVREPMELAGPLRRIEGCENIPLQSLAGAVGDWNRDEAVVLICRSGARSASAAMAMESLQFKKVASLRGGMMDWNQQGLPTV